MPMYSRLEETKTHQQIANTTPTYKGYYKEEKENSDILTEIIAVYLLF